MADFRDELYARYVSTFKAGDSLPRPDWAESYFAWCMHKYLPLLRDIPKDADILELGCGPGVMLEFLRRQGFTAASGIDLSREQIQIAQDAGLSVRVADVFEHLAAAPGRFRAILAIDFLEHFSKDELMRLIPAIRSALEPGGCLIVQTPNGEGLFPHQVAYGDLTHLTILTPGSLSQLLRLWDFEDLHFAETGPAPKNLRGRVRTLAWAVIKRCASLLRTIETGKSQDIWTENMICRCTRGATAD